MTQPEIKVLPDSKALAEEAAGRIIDAARNAIAEKGSFALALAGGGTPKALYELLASEPYRSQVDWERVQVYFGDERAVPPDSPESNYRMASQALLSKVPIAAQNIFRMHGEDDPKQAAAVYSRLLKERFGDDGLDLVLLGMGDDGHTASLFPGTAALNERSEPAVANYVDKLKSWRLTLSAPFINRARQILVLVSGAGKAKTAQLALEGPENPTDLPIQLLRNAKGRVTWLLDAAAAGMHEED